MTQDGGSRGQGGVRASFHAAQRILFSGFALLLSAYIVQWCITHHALATDFDHEFWPAAARVIHGLSPYDRAWMHIQNGVAFPYPALTAVVFVPLAALPHGFADIVFTAMSITAVPLTLWVLRIRDRRVYGVALLWPAVFEAWQAANLTLVLGLGIACMWRKRDNPLIAGALAATLISLKPFVWPLGLWLIATRRYAAAGYALVTGVVINAVAWGLVGFDQLHRYDRVVQTVTNVMYKRGYDIVAFAMKLGAVHIVAYLCGLALAGVAGLACLYYGRRANDRSALTLAIALSLLATPVLWTHYFALAIIPLALARPRLSGAWFLPLLMAVCPVNPAAWQLAVALALIGTVFAITLRRGDPSAEPVEPTSVVHHVGSKPPRIAAFAAR